MKTIDASIGTIINTYKLLSIASEKLGSRKTEIIYTCKCIVCKKIRKLRKSRFIDTIPRCDCRESWFIYRRANYVWKTMWSFKVLKELPSIPVIKKTSNNERSTRIFKCKCIKCGNIVIKNRAWLINNKNRQIGWCINCKSKILSATILKKNNKNIGKKFNMLTIVKYLWTRLRPNSINNRKEWYYLCKCDCGKQREVSCNDLFQYRTKSCWCANSLWYNMKQFIWKKTYHLLIKGVVPHKKRTYFDVQCDCWKRKLMWAQEVLKWICKTCWCGLWKRGFLLQSEGIKKNFNL